VRNGHAPKETSRRLRSSRRLRWRNRLTSGPPGRVLPAWSPDGTDLVLGCCRPQDMILHVMNANGRCYGGRKDEPRITQNVLFASGRQGNAIDGIVG